MTSSFWDRLVRWAQGGSERRRAPKRRAASLQVEALEDRALLSGGHIGTLAGVGGPGKPPPPAALQQPLPGSRVLPNGLVLDDTITLPGPGGATTIEIFSKYPLPPGVGPGLKNQLLSPTPATFPVSGPPAGTSVTPLFLTYSGPTLTQPPAPMYVSAIDPTTGKVITYLVTFVSAPAANLQVSLPGGTSGKPVH